VIQIRSQDLLPDTMGEALARALEASSPWIEAGALVTVDPIQNRIRLLPISRTR
jgi:hypothetical protein